MPSCEDTTPQFKFPSSTSSILQEHYFKYFVFGQENLYVLKAGVEDRVGTWK
jgi:hypothetical protein